MQFSQTLSWFPAIQWSWGATKSLNELKENGSPILRQRPYGAGLELLGQGEVLEHTAVSGHSVCWSWSPQASLPELWWFCCGVWELCFWFFSAKWRSFSNSPRWTVDPKRIRRSSWLFSEHLRKTMSSCLSSGWRAWAKPTSRTSCPQSAAPQPQSLVIDPTVRIWSHVHLRRSADGHLCRWAHGRVSDGSHRLLSSLNCRHGALS